MAWGAYLIKVRSGEIGPRVEPASLSWSISLNETETASVHIMKSSLPDLDYSHWLAPWWGGILLTWDGLPVFAGPIVSQPSETFDVIQLSCKGLRALLAKRFIVQELTNWDTVSTTTIQYTGLSLGTIAKRVVQQVQQKPGGSLPIAFPIADQTVADDADHQRTYQGYNIQNINCDAVLTKLSNVINGPDIMFRPRLIDDSHFVWDMWTGVEQDPRIYQQYFPTWDTTAAKGSVTDLQITATGVYQTHRVFGIGSGQDQGTLIKETEDLSLLNEGFPLLETSISANTDNPTIALNVAKGSLTTNLKSLLEIAMTVRADGLYPIGTFWAGNLTQVYVKGWITISDGVHRMRLLNMSGDLTSDIRLSLQTEE